MRLSCALGKWNVYLLDDGHSPRRKWPWILYVVVDDAVKHLLLILTGKRRLESQQREVNASNAITKSDGRWRETNETNLSHEHLVDEDAHPPPVHCTGVVVVCQDLGGQKLRSPTEGGGSVPMTDTCRNGHKAVIADETRIITCKIWPFPTDFKWLKSAHVTSTYRDVS